MENNKKNYIIPTIIVLILLSILGILYSYNNKDIEILEEEKRFVLNDYSRFFTIESCVSKYIDNVEKKNTTNLLKILDSDFIEQNSIDETNIYSYIDNLESNYSFISKIIYYEDLSKDKIKYYVFGTLKEEIMDSISTNEIEKYYIVNFDLKNDTFSIMPYNGEIFKENNNE